MIRIRFFWGTQVIISRQTLRDGKRWIVFCAILLVAVHFTYRAHVHHSLHGLSGGSVHGLVYGCIGTAAIIFAMLLLAKKTWRTRRVGSAYAWMHGHVWLGLVSYPLIWYHAGWRFGGPLTTILMWIFTAVWVSGIVGLLLQNLIPRILFDRVSMETIYDQIDRVDRENLKAARKLVRARAEAINDDVPSSPAEKNGPVLPGTALRTFYDAQVRPYMASGLRPGPASWGIPWRRSWRTWLGPAARRPSVPPAPGVFAAMRSRYPGLFFQVNALEDMVNQRKQHILQKRLHWALHGWLLLHVPLSILLMVLIPMHALLALRYW